MLKLFIYSVPSTPRPRIAARIRRRTWTFFGRWEFEFRDRKKSRPY